MTTIVDLTNPAKLQEKEQKLFSILGSLGRVIVAYSGGTDSAYLAWAAQQALGDGRAGHYGGFRIHPRIPQARCRAVRSPFGIRHEYIATYEFDNPDYVKNDPDRCFHCKDELFTRLEEVGRSARSGRTSFTA